MYRRTYLNIPISLCIYALKNGLIGQLSLYCYLKSQSDGTIKNPASFRLAYCKAVGCTKQTYYNRFRWLIRHKWIYYVSEDVVTVLSFQKLLDCRSIEVTTNRGTLCEQNEYPYFSSFICASVITYFARKKRWLDARTGVIKRGASRGVGTPALSLPHKYLATCLNTSKSNAHFFAQCSKKHLVIHQNYDVLSEDPAELNLIRKYSGNPADQIVLRNGVVVLQKSNTFYSSIVIKKRKSNYRSQKSNLLDRS